ncbi:hypothetical protein XPA_000966 [Xanthoria parietina]
MPTRATPKYHDLESEYGQTTVDTDKIGRLNLRTESVEPGSPSSVTIHGESPVCIVKDALKMWHDERLGRRGEEVLRKVWRLLSDFINHGPEWNTTRSRWRFETVRYIAAAGSRANIRLDAASEERDRRSTSTMSDTLLDPTVDMAKDPSIQEKSKRPSSRREQSVALGTGTVVKRRATEMEAGEECSEDGKAVVQSRKKRKDNFKDKVREAQKISNDDFTPLVATHEEWREVLKVTQERYRVEAARKRGHKKGDAEAVAAGLEDDDADAEKAVLAFCAVFGHVGTNRAWEYLRMVQDES